MYSQLWSCGPKRFKHPTLQHAARLLQCQFTRGHATASESVTETYSKSQWSVPEASADGVPAVLNAANFRTGS